MLLILSPNWVKISNYSVFQYAIGCTLWWFWLLTFIHIWHEIYQKIILTNEIINIKHPGGFKYLKLDCLAYKMKLADLLISCFYCQLNSRNQKYCLWNKIKFKDNNLTTPQYITKSIDKEVRVILPTATYNYINTQFL